MYKLLNNYAEQTAPAPPSTERLKAEQLLAGLSELLALTLDEWRLIDRKLIVQTGQLLQEIESFTQGFEQASNQQLEAEHEKLLARFCSWKQRAEAISDDGFPRRALAQLLSNCPQSEVSAPTFCKTLGVHEETADYLESWFYRDLNLLGRLMSWIRLAEPRPFLRSIQVAAPADVASAATMLTLKTPLFALLTSKLQYAWPEAGPWALSELLRSLFLSMLPPSSSKSIGCAAVQEMMQKQTQEFGESVWARFGEQTLLRYGALPWMLATVQTDWPVNELPIVSCEQDHFAQPAKSDVRKQSPILDQLQMLLGAAQGNKVVEAKKALLQEAIVEKVQSRSSMISQLDQSEKFANRLWCEILPID